MSKVIYISPQNVEHELIVDDVTPMEVTPVDDVECVVESVAFFSQPGVVVTINAVVVRLKSAHGIEMDFDGLTSVVPIVDAVETGLVRADGDLTVTLSLTPEGRELAVERGWAVQTCLRCNDALREVDISEDGWCEDCVAIVNALDAERIDDQVTDVESGVGDVCADCDATMTAGDANETDTHAEFVCNPCFAVRLEDDIADGVDDHDYGFGDEDGPLLPTSAPDTPPDMRYGTAEREIERDGESSPVFFYRAAMGKATLVDAIECEGCQDYLSGLKNNKQRAQFLNDLDAAKVRLEDHEHCDEIHVDPSECPPVEDDESDTPLTFGDLVFQEFARTKRGALRMFVRQSTTNPDKVVVVRQRKDGTWTNSTEKASALATLVDFPDDPETCCMHPVRLAAEAAMTRKDRDALLVQVEDAPIDGDPCPDCGVPQYYVDDDGPLPPHDCNPAPDDDPNHGEGDDIEASAESDYEQTDLAVQYVDSSDNLEQRVAAQGACIVELGRHCGDAKERISELEGRLAEGLTALTAATDALSTLLTQLKRR